MRIGELSDRTGVPVPTIKYYVREGLLSGGERLNRTQVSYDEGHVRRLRLVRALVEVGSMPITKVREVLAEVDSPGRDLDTRLGILAHGLAQVQNPADEPTDELVAEARAIAERQGWTSVERTNIHIRTLAEVIGRLRLLGMEDMIERAEAYARAADMVAESDIDLLRAQENPDRLLETMITGTVLGDAMFAALRRIAHAEISGRSFKETAEAAD